MNHAARATVKAAHDLSVAMRHSLIHAARAALHAVAGFLQMRPLPTVTVLFGDAFPVVRPEA